MWVQRHSFFNGQSQEGVFGFTTQYTKGTILQEMLLLIFCLAFRRRSLVRIP